MTRNIIEIQNQNTPHVLNGVLRRIAKPASEHKVNQLKSSIGVITRERFEQRISRDNADNQLIELIATLQEHLTPIQAYDTLMQDALYLAAAMVAQHTELGDRKYEAAARAAYHAFRTSKRYSAAAANRLYDELGIGDFNAVISS